MQRPSFAILAASAALSAMLAAAPAAAQGGLSKTDRDYLDKDARGAAYELALAKLAIDKASRDDIKAYARKLVADHDGYNAALQALGRSKNADLPTDMGTADSVKLTAMKALSGTLFDKAFLEEQARINADDVEEADKERSATTDPAVKEVVGRGAAMDKEHETLARSLQGAK